MTLTLPALVALGLIILVLLAVLVVWRIRSVKTITRPPAPPPRDRSREIIPDRPELRPPSFSEMMPPRAQTGGFSAQLQTPSHNIRVETSGENRRYVVDGISYSSLEEIADAQMRVYAEKLLNKIVQPRDMYWTDEESVRQVVSGNQRTIEARSPNYTLSVQTEGGKTRYVVNGLTFYNLKDIPDPDMIRKARDLQSKMI